MPSFSADDSSSVQWKKSVAELLVTQQVGKRNAGWTQFLNMHLIFGQACSEVCVQLTQEYPWFIKHLVFVHKNQPKDFLNADDMAVT